MNDPIYLAVVILEVALIVWGITKLVKWIKRTTDKQQEISMIKAQAMKTAAENAHKKDDTST